ncbi:MAG: hypothetical protein AAFN70_09195 [Planctomycetota bacterium]
MKNELWIGLAIVTILAAIMFLGTSSATVANAETQPLPLSEPLPTWLDSARVPSQCVNCHPCPAHVKPVRHTGTRLVVNPGERLVAINGRPVHFANAVRVVPVAPPSRLIVVPQTYVPATQYPVCKGRQCQNRIR